MGRFHRREDPNGTEDVDRHVRSAAERSRPLQHSNTYESVRREDRGAPVASAHIRRNRTERLARRDEDELRRRDRVLGHTILGSVAIVVFLAMLPIIGSLLTFAIAVVALFVGLRSLTFAMSIGLDDAWGWTRNGGTSVPLRWSDHVVLAGLAWLRRRSEATIDEPTAGAVQVLPPEPPR